MLATQGTKERTVKKVNMTVFTEVYCHLRKKKQIKVVIFHAADPSFICLLMKVVLISMLVDTLFY